MTHTINGVGTHLCGVRRIKKEEADNWVDNFPFVPNRSIYDYLIGTESVVFLFIPILPLKTVVFYHPYDSGAAYQVIYHPPKGKATVYWEHVKTSLSFYIVPLAILVYTIESIIKKILRVPTDDN